MKNFDNMGGYKISGAGSGNSLFLSSLFPQNVKLVFSLFLGIHIVLQDRFFLPCLPIVNQSFQARQRGPNDTWLRNNQNVIRK